MSTVTLSGIQLPSLLLGALVFVAIFMSFSFEGVMIRNPLTNRMPNMHRWVCAAGFTRSVVSSISRVAKFGRLRWVFRPKRRVNAREQPGSAFSTRPVAMYRPHREGAKAGISAIHVFQQSIRR